MADDETTEGAPADDVTMAGGEPTAPLTGTPVPAAPAEPPPGPPPEAPPEPPLRNGRRRGGAIVAILLALSLVGNVFAYLRWQDARDDADTLAEKVAALRKDTKDLRAEVKELRKELSGPGDGGEDSGDGGLGDLLGGEGGGLEDLLGELLGGEGGGLEDLLGELLGGEGGGLGGLGGIDTLMSCLGGGDLSGLLGGGGEGGEGAAIPDDDAEAQYDAVVEWVEDERGLEFGEVPDPVYVDGPEMTRRIQDDLSETYPEDVAALDSALFAALGVVEPGTDVLQIYRDFLGEAVAGYYDPETGELVVLSEDPSEPLGGYEVIALAHELEHALADQKLEIPDDDMPPGASDEWLAQLALIEGDATLVMTRFQFEALDPTDMMGLLGSESQAEAQAALEAAPHFVGAELQFPYNDGLGFTCALDAEGGYEAIDTAYAEPPTTTAQVLFPERYTEGEGAADPPDLAGPDGWAEERTRTFGAAELMWLFEAPGDDTSAALSDPRSLVGAWAGGQMTQWSKGGDSAVGLSFVERDGSDGLCEPIQEWYRAAFPGDSHDDDGSGGMASEGEGRAAAVTCDGGTVRVGLGPDLETARAIAGGPAV